VEVPLHFDGIGGLDKEELVALLPRRVAAIFADAAAVVHYFWECGITTVNPVVLM